MVFVPNPGKHIRQGIRCSSVRRPDEPGIDVRCGAGLGVAQTARHRRNRNVGGDQQACVGVPQAVEVYRREIMGSEEPREPRCYRLGVDGGHRSIW